MRCPKICPVIPPCRRRWTPQEMKEIMGKVFGEISEIVARYDGFIEKFIGDAVMAPLRRFQHP